MIKSDVIKQLIFYAKKAMNNAYAPISNHGVGAAILTTKDNIYIGCNVQSVISGLGTCAERSAVDNSIAHGEYNFKAVCVVSKTKIYPCGACLQYLGEFSNLSGKNIEIIMADEKGHYSKTNLHSLLPHLYGSKNSKRNLSKYVDKPDKLLK